MQYTVKELEKISGIKCTSGSKGWRLFTVELRKRGFRPIVARYQGKLQRMWTDQERIIHASESPGFDIVAAADRVKPLVGQN